MGKFLIKLNSDQVNEKTPQIYKDPSKILKWRLSMTNGVIRENQQEAGLPQMWNPEHDRGCRGSRPVFRQLMNPGLPRMWKKLVEGRGVGNKRHEMCLFTGIVREQNLTWVDTGVIFKIKTCDAE